MDSLIRSRRPTGPIAGLGRRVPVRAPSTLWVLALAVVLLAPLLAPMATPVSAADESVATEEVTPAVQDDGETQDSGDGGQGDDGAVETPLAQESPGAQESPVAEETPVAEESPDAELTAGDPFTSAIWVLVWVCGAEHGDDIQQWTAACQIDQQTTFGISGTGVFVAADARGQHIATGLPADTYTIRVDATTDFGAPTVFCGVAPTDSTGGGSPTQVVTSNDRYTFDLGPNESITCNWFNTPKAVDTGELWLYKMICPEDHRFDYFAADPSELDQRCDLYDGDALSYSLSSHVSGTTDQRDIDHEFAAFIWSDVPAGQVTLTELGWNAGASLLYCATYPGAATWFKVDVSADRTASFEIPADLNVACRWYAIPSGTVTVTINMHDCPDGFDAAEADIYGLAQHCDGYEDGIGFGAYTFHGGLLDEQATGDTFSHGVTFVGLPVGGDEHPAVGGLVFTEQAREGYGQPRVFCKVTDALGNQSAQQEWTVLWSDGYYGVGYYTGDTFADHGDVAYCDWFNVPESEDLSTTDPDGDTGSADDADTGSAVEEEDDTNSDAETGTDSEEVTDTNESTGRHRREVLLAD